MLLFLIQSLPIFICNQYSLNRGFTLVDSIYFINLVHDQCYINDTRLTHSYNETSNQCKTQNTEISVAFCLEQYIARTLLKSDLIDGIRIFCNDGQYTAIKIDAIWYLKSFDAVLHICHCV